MPGVRDDLLARWTRLAGATDEASQLGDELVERWAEPHRRYHTIDHLAAVLGVLDDLLIRSPTTDDRVVLFAAWFHDAVYDPRRSDNEEESAKLAEDQLSRLGIEADAVAAVARLVRMTASHHPNDLDGDLLSDADLAVLALDGEEYTRYVSRVRDEFDFVPDDAWRAGRSRVLETLLAEPALFRTPSMQPLQESARRNIERELDQLRHGRST